MTLTTMYQLSNGVEIPIVGFGTWQSPDGEVAEEAVLSALKAGYRHIDTAAVYKNEASVGRAIAKSGIPREELFVTTKLWNDQRTYESARQAIDDSLERLGLDYVDLYLIHWPNPKQHRDNWQAINEESWRAMEEGVADGKIRAIGVSNFHPHHLEPLLKTAKIKPVVNQIYLNPSDQQETLVKFNEANGLLSQAYSPLGTGSIFEIEELQKLADKYQKTIAQLVLRWSLQRGFLPLPKSVTERRIIENSLLFDFEITPEDMTIINGLQGKAGKAPNPDTKDY